MMALRIASWIVVVCALVGALGIVMPAFEVPIAGHVMSKRETLSLRKAAGDRALVRKVLAAYRGSAGTRVGGKVLAKVRPHAHGRLDEYLGDASDAMDTLSGISDDDARTYGTLFAVVLWSFVGLNVAMAVFALVGVVRGRYRRAHLVVDVVLAVVVAAVGAAIFYGCKLAVFEANDEIGSDVLALGSAPYVILAVVVGALVATVAALVVDVRRAKGDRLAGGGRAG